MNKCDDIWFKTAWFMNEFINQIEDDVLREQMEAALRRLPP